LTPYSAALKITYLISGYPVVSHTFIRREILALERMGFSIQRVSTHGWEGFIPDPTDLAEREKTLYVVQRGVAGLVLPTLRVMLRHPLRFLTAVRMAWRLRHEADRPVVYHFVYVMEACQILFWVRKFGSTHVHAHFGNNPCEVAMMMQVLGGPPFSFTLHGPGEFEMKSGLREKIHRCAFVAGVSSYGRGQLYLRSDPADWPKVNVVHCGLETDFYDAIEPVPIPAVPRLVCVGRMCEAKGQLLLLEATARLVAKGISFKLVLAGDGPMRGVLEAFIEKHGLSEVVRITGWLSSGEVRSAILSSHALVLPSLSEGLPVVLMEALVLRRPVLTTYIAGIPELVRPGENGWLFPCGSVEDLADAMENCLAKPLEELQRMGDAGHERVVARHSIDTEAAKLAKLFLRSAEQEQAG
jgi:colanic acid/amylovoran biosynthesis glycosyltransferase